MVAKNYVGFGPIQTGLMLLEAMEAKTFSSFTIVETDQALVDAVKSNGNRVWLNVADKSGITHRELSGFRIGNPNDPGERLIIEEAIWEAEEFNRIYVSRIRLPAFRKGIAVFEEKEDLLLFEEAKLYGHNAVHSLLVCRVMSAIGSDRELLDLGRKAFLEESGAALIRKYGSTGEPLFTGKGFRLYAEDLLEQMINPYLHDRVERICRDPLRKLGYGDRIFGTIRSLLLAAWKNEAMDQYKEQCISLVIQASPVCP